MNKILVLGLGVVLMSLAGCITTVDGHQRPKPKEDNIRAKSYLDLGIAYMERKRYDLAEPKLRYSIQIKPSAEAYNALGVLYEEQHNNALAEETYKRLLAEFPDYDLGYMNYYVFLCKYDRQSQIEALSAKMKSKGRALAALGQVSAGNCAFDKGNKSRAQYYYQQALKYAPHSAEALLPLAQINYEKGLLKKAKQQVDLVNNLVGYSARSVYLSVLINRALGHRLEARNFLQVLKTQFAGSKEASMITEE